MSSAQVLCQTQKLKIQRPTSFCGPEFTSLSMTFSESNKLSNCVFYK